MVPAAAALAAGIGLQHLARGVTETLILVLSVAAAGVLLFFCAVVWKNIYKLKIISNNENADEIVLGDDAEESEESEKRWKHKIREFAIITAVFLLLGIIAGRTAESEESQFAGHFGDSAVLTGTVTGVQERIDTDSEGNTAVKWSFRLLLDEGGECALGSTEKVTGVQRPEQILVSISRYGNDAFRRQIPAYSFAGYGT